MKNFDHYRRGYFMPPVESTDWVLICVTAIRHLWFP